MLKATDTILENICEMTVMLHLRFLAKLIASVGIVFLVREREGEIQNVAFADSSIGINTLAAPLGNFHCETPPRTHK